MKYSLGLLFTLSILFFNNLLADQLIKPLNINGYSNISTYTSSNNNDINEKKVDLNLGLQGRYSITENLGATAQLSLSTNDAFASINNYNFEKKWLYLDYYLGRDTTFRAGLFQLPVFQTLETGDIGYAKTWTNDPLEIYGVHGYDHFNGIELLKNFFYDDKMYSLQFSYGKADAKLGDFPNRRVYEYAKTKNLLGITLKIIDDNYKINLGYLHGISNLDRVDKVTSVSTPIGKTELDMLALESQFDIDDLTIKAGIIDGKVSRILPDELRYYTSLEYNLGKFTPYTYYSYEKLTNKGMRPPPPPAPPIIQIDNIAKKISIGLRYELTSDAAIKFSYSNENRYQKSKNISLNSESTAKTKSNIFRLVFNVVF